MKDKGGEVDRRPVALCLARPFSIHLADPRIGPRIKQFDSLRLGLRGMTQKTTTHNAAALPPLAAVMRMRHRLN